MITVGNITTKALKRHGDLLIRRVAEIPKTAKKAGNVLAEGETTGHKHRLTGKLVQVFKTEPQELKLAGGNPQVTTWIRAEQVSELVHEEHKPITIEEGIYAVVNEREFDPFESEIRRVAD